jgi:hypothetical protein
VFGIVFVVIVFPSVCSSYPFSFEFPIAML